MNPSRLLLVALLGASSVASAARNEINGQVLDRQGEPVHRAIISLEPGNVELVTDRDGRFLIDYLRDDDGERSRLKRKIDYTVEVFKPGYHTESYTFYYKRGRQEVPTFTIKEETIKISDDGQDLDPELYQDQTQSSGATYEGQ